MHSNNFFSVSNKIQRAEINVTPFVDVMLVLLLIFMLTSHMINAGVDVELPVSDATKSVNNECISISVDKKSNIYVQKTLVRKDALIERISVFLKENPKTCILLRADKSVQYGEIVQVFAALKQLSVANVTLITKNFD